MNDEARTLVKKLLQEGKRYDDVRRALISHGHSTEGFEDEYPDIQKELGIKEPPPRKIEPHSPAAANEAARKYATELDSDKKRQKQTKVLKTLAALVVIVLAGLLLSGFGTKLLDMLIACCAV